MNKPVYLTLALLASVVLGAALYVGGGPGTAPQPLAPPAPAAGQADDHRLETPALERRSAHAGLVGAETPEEAARAASYRAEHERSAEDHLAAMQPIPAPWPLAMREIGPSVGLGPEQIAAVYAVREEFTRAMRNAGDPNSPEYVERWLAAQQRADDLIVAYLGGETVSRLDLKPE